MSPYQWGDGVGAEDETPHSPDQPDTAERPLTSFLYLVFSAAKDGEEMTDGADTLEECQDLLAQLIADPTVVHWVCYQKVGTKSPSLAEPSVADQQS